MVLVIIINLMNKIDDYFQQIAYSLGFKPEDLLPIDREVVKLQSQRATKAMSEKERQFYINRKMTTLIQRQNNIFRQVEQQIKKRQYTYKLSNAQGSTLHNPAVKKILDHHQKIIKNNKKYLDTFFNKKAIDQKQQERKRSISSQKNRMGQSFRSNNSGASNRSHQSARSNRTSVSNRSNRSTDSNRQRLMLIRSKEKEQLELRKQAIRAKQQQDSKKYLKAIENSSRKSQRAKVMSTINKQIVDENKKQLSQIKNQEIKDHIERLKYKIKKTEMIRNRNIQQRQQKLRSLNNSNSNYKQIKKRAEEEQKKIIKSRLQDKHKTVELRKQNKQFIKSQAINFNRMVRNIKSENAKKIRQYKNQQDQLFLKNVAKFEEYRLRTAQINRSAIKDISRQRYIQRQIKQDIARKNIESVNNRRFRQTQELKRKIDDKFNTINEINQIKKKLSKDRDRYKREIANQRKSMEVSNYRPKFNSFFDL